MRRRRLLGVHVLGALCWLVSVAMLTVLGFSSSVFSPDFADALAVRMDGTANAVRWAVLPFAAVTMLTGFELARRWREYWPRGVTAQFVIAVIIIASTAAIIILHPGYNTVIRIGHVILLISAFILAVVWKPAATQPQNTSPVPQIRSTPRPRTGPKHRA